MEYLCGSSRRNSAKVRGETPRKFTEFLGEYSQSFSAKSHGEKNGLCERLRIFVGRVNAKKELFSWADLYVCLTGYEIAN